MDVNRTTVRATAAAPQPSSGLQGQQKQDEMEQLADIFLRMYGEMTEDQRADLTLAVAARA